MRGERPRPRENGFGPAGKCIRGKQAGPGDLFRSAEFERLSFRLSHSRHPERTPHRHPTQMGARARRAGAISPHKDRAGVASGATSAGLPGRTKASSVFAKSRSSFAGSLSEISIGSPPARRTASPYQLYLLRSPLSSSFRVRYGIPTRGFWLGWEAIESTSYHRQCSPATASKPTGGGQRETEMPVRIISGQTISKN